MIKIKKYVKNVLVIFIYIISGSFLIFWAYFTLFNSPDGIYQDGKNFQITKKRKNEKKLVKHYFTIDNKLFSLTFSSQPGCTQKASVIKGVKLIFNNCILKEKNDTRQYIANWISYPDSIKSHDPKNILKQTLDEKIKITNIKIASQRFVEEKNYYAIKYKTEESNGISADGMIIYSGNTVYDLVFLHYIDDGKTADDFLESFNLK